LCAFWIGLFGVGFMIGGIDFIGHSFVL
jgi:hypothetical protein